MAKKKILIIEDDQSLVNLIKRAVSQRQYEVFLALAANEGFDQALLQQPNLIILDILLPGQNGFECLQRLKEHPKTKTIPVIILSNLGQDEEIRLGLSLGAVDYLVKADFSIDEVVEKLEKYLES